ncbi:MAG: hypothetical protein IJJ60_10400, partial [Clostridia bacterium]|nr:hypothetical protein [Clostridia bacterium]
VKRRAWVFRTVGYGHDLKTWKDMMSALRIVGYDGPVSIEHEDGLMSGEEGSSCPSRFSNRGRSPRCGTPRPGASHRRSACCPARRWQPHCKCPGRCPWHGRSK